MRRSVLVIIGAMKSMCGVLYRNCTAIKSTFHRAMKRNGRNSDCKGEVTSRNTLRIRVSNPYYALLSMITRYCTGSYCTGSYCTGPEAIYA